MKEVVAKHEILFIAGGAFEIGGSKIVGVNLHELIKTNLAPNDLIAAIHDQGGLAIAADPAKFASSEDYALADAMEVYNARSAWLAVGSIIDVNRIRPAHCGGHN